MEVDRKLSFRKLLVDRSGIGEAVMDELRKEGVASAEGARFTRDKNVEYLAYMKLTMQQGRFKMPYDQKLCTQMNEQRYEYSPSGQLRFWHPPGSRDDLLWAVALALWATKRDSDGVIVVKWLAFIIFLTSVYGDSIFWLIFSVRYYFIGSFRFYNARIAPLGPASPPTTALVHLFNSIPVLKHPFQILV